MRAVTAACALLLCGVSVGQAQQPTPRDTLKKAPPDTSLAADSAAIAAELAANQAGPINPRLLPDISAVGDLIADLSPDGSTQEDRSRFGVREVEVALQAAVDPYFRGDLFLGVSDEEGISIEQVFITTTSLPASLELRLGRYLMPFGKQNLTHRHDLHTVEYPFVIQQFFGPEGLKGTGAWLSRIFAPFGFYQELQLTAVDLVDEAAEDLVVFEKANHELSGLGFSARLRNYWDLSEAANLELSASALTGKRPQPADFELVCVAPQDGEEDACVNAINARQTVLGADVTFRWRPLQRGLYKSFILQAEVMTQLNESDPDVPAELTGFSFAGPSRDFVGGYVFARYQITRRGFLGSRFDWLEDPAADGDALRAISGVFEFFPSEFSKLIASYERVIPAGDGEGVDRFLFQASFSLGPHKPHPF